MDTRVLRHLTGGFLLCAALLGATLAQAAGSCQAVADRVNRQTGNKLDSGELTGVLQALGQTGRLPSQFVTKKQAMAEGWHPGKNLWSIPALRGKSMGGDRFGNFEHQLPPGKWQEADLHYKGGKRSAYRLVYSRGDQRFVSVDHYQHFIEVPPCQ